MAELDFSLFGRRRVRHVRQTEVVECGLACLAMLASFYGLDIDLNTLRRQYAPSMRGATLRSLMRIADQLGLAPRPVKLSLEALPSLQLPAILHWDMNHYVVLERFERETAYILDPATGSAQRLTMQEVSHHFTGIAMELRPAEGFKPADRRQRLRLSQLWGRLTGWKRIAAQTLVLTLILQIFTLASPYYMQIAVDSVIPALDRNLLAVLALGFGLLTIFNAGASLLRGFVLLSAGVAMSYALTSNLGRRLFRLPVSWFERRHVGDVLSRFQSVHPIQESLTQGLVSSLVDGALTVLTFTLMAWYSAKLALIAVIAFALYAMIRAVSFKFERESREMSIVSTGREQSILIETLRGITTLRLFGREAERYLLWQDRLTDETNAVLKVSRIGVWQSSANTLIFGLENIITIWLAVRLVIDGGFSVGMIIAYLAYKEQFLTRISSLIDQVIAFQLLGLHLDRLGDIALQEEDRGFEQAMDGEADFGGHLQIKDIRYRYSSTDPWVLNGVNLDIPPGSHIAITGPSGGGKSTLAKIILGLDEPEDGEILVDGVPLYRFGYRNYRSKIAAILQNDSLFAGSIADNISLFDEEPDQERIALCGMLAAIHDEIQAMPMRYETLVGDMGSALSGGQKARVLLARALYHRPKLLLLDEGTAHLDSENEALVNEAIASLGITRIIIAHRAETIRNAEKAFVLVDGHLKPFMMPETEEPYVQSASEG